MRRNHPLLKTGKAFNNQCAWLHADIKYSYWLQPAVMRPVTPAPAVSNQRK